MEVREIISSFLDDADDGGQQEAAVLRSASGSMDVEQAREVDDHGQMGPEEPDTCSDEDFWASLPVVSNREEHMLSVPTKPDRYYPGGKVQSRAEALGKFKLRAEDVVNYRG